MPRSRSNDDLFAYSVDNVLRQIRNAEPTLGFYEVRFYTSGRRPSKRKTDEIGTFFYYPSGGTLRDRDMNIVYYEPKLDVYRHRHMGAGDETPGTGR